MNQNMDEESQNMDVTQIHKEITRSLEDHSNNNKALLDSSKGKKVVAFIGNTGAGKSTLLNLLNNIPMSINMDEEIVLENPNDTRAMKPGMGGTSQTYLPSSVQVGDSLYYDLPGFGDNRGTAINILNASFIKNIIEQAASVRLVFVTGQDEITGSRGESFKTLLTIIKQLCPQTEQLEKSCLLVITKSQKETSEDLIKFLAQKIDNNKDLQIFLHPDRIQPFSRKIDNEQKNLILQKINSLPPIKISFVQIDAVYRTDVRNELRYVFQFEMILILNKISTNHETNLTNQNEVLQAIEYFQTQFEMDVEQELQNSKLIRLLRPLSDHTYLEEEKKFTKQFEEKKQMSLSQLNVTKTIFEKEEESKKHLIEIHEEKQLREQFEKDFRITEAQLTEKEKESQEWKQKCQQAEQNQQQQISLLRQEITEGNRQRQLQDDMNRQAIQTQQANNDKMLQAMMKLQEDAKRAPQVVYREKKRGLCNIF